MDSPYPSQIYKTLLLIAAIALIFLSMIFSATESAFLSINKLRVRLLKNQKNKRAIRVWKLLSDKDKLINTLLVGNNIVNVSLSAIITYAALKIFGNAGVTIATFFATMILLVFGEITPKTIATRHPEPIAFFFSGFISVLQVVLSPLVLLFTAISKLSLKALGVDSSKNKVSYTQEEIKTFIEVGSEQGLIEKNEKTMMHRVFKFSDLAAKDIMIPRKKIIAVPLNSTYMDIVELSERHKLSRFPVYKKDIDDIVGILYIKDLLFCKTKSEAFSVAKVMRPPLFILETKKMSSIQIMLRENRQGMADVIDEYSGTSGVLTSEDIAREIFGPITDEYKPYARRVEVRIKNPNNAEVEGLARLVDLNEQLNIHLDSPDSETLGGLICETLGHIPTAGETIEKEGYRFIVSKMDDKRVAKVVVRRIDAAQGE